METEIIVQNFMKKYNELVDDTNISKIKKIIDDLNIAIASNDMTRANTDYEKILGWNFKIANLEGERESLNRHLRGVKLPSVMMFNVIYDDNEKVWKFNA
jgi:hypothetical protein